MTEEDNEEVETDTEVNNIFNADVEELQEIISEIDSGIEDGDELIPVLESIKHLSARMIENDAEGDKFFILEFPEKDALAFVRGALYLMLMNSTNIQVIEAIAEELFGMPMGDLHNMVLTRITAGTPLIDLLQQYVEKDEPQEIDNSMFVATDPTVVN